MKFPNFSEDFQDNVVASLIASFVFTLLLNWRAIPRAYKKHRVRDVDHRFANVRQFWHAARNGNVSYYDRISVRGTLSYYAPMLVGDPLDKRQYHLDFRRGIAGKTLSKEEQSAIDGQLSFSSGNTLWRLQPRHHNVYCGLYFGIGRSCIPVFVKESMFDNEGYDENIFGGHAECCSKQFSEVDLSGVVVPMQDWYLSGNTGKNALVVPGDTPSYALFVGSNRTAIKRVGEPNYVDGDIWVALRDKNNVMSHRPSRFLDLADDDLTTQRSLLEEEVNERFGENYELIQQFDEVDPIIKHRRPIVDIDDINDRLPRDVEPW